MHHQSPSLNSNPSTDRPRLRRRHHRNLRPWLWVATTLFMTCSPSPANSPAQAQAATQATEPETVYVDAFVLVQEAEVLRRAGEIDKAIDALSRAEAGIERVSRQWPDWNRAMVQQRLRRVRESLEQLRHRQAEAGGAASPAAPILPPPPEMVADGVPPVPLALARDVERYLEFRSAAFLDWHPQERRMLISTRFAETPQLHLVEMPGGARRQLTFAAEPIVSGAFHPRHGDYLIYSSDQGGGEFHQFHRLDPVTGLATLLTDGQSRNTGASWSRSGDWLAFSSTRRTGSDTDIWLMNPDQPDQTSLLLEREGGGWSARDWSPEETRLIIGEYLSVNESHLHLLDLQTGELVPLTAALDQPAAHFSPRFTADGRAIHVISDSDSEFLQLVRIDLEDLERTVLSGDIEWNVEEFEPSQEGDRLAVVTNEDGFSVLRILSAEDGTELLRADLPPAVIGGLRWTSDDSELAFTLSAAQAAGDAWSMDTTSGELTPWTRSETGGMDPQAFVEPELVRTPSFDELEITSIVYRPDQERHPGPRPVIINIHGGPEAQSRPRFLGRNNYYLDELGCALVYPNVRGSTGYGKTFVTLDNGRLREDAVRDIGTVLDWIETQPDMDASRVAVMGASYGGYMVLASLMHHGDRLACGINIVGISNFVTFLENTEGYRRDLRRVEYGDERDPEMRRLLEDISPLNHLERITRPLLVVHGANDPRVPQSEADQLVQGLRAQGSEAPYLLALNEGHGFRRKANADYQFLVQIGFLRRHLLDVEAEQQDNEAEGPP